MEMSLSNAELAARFLSDAELMETWLKSDEGKASPWFVSMAVHREIKECRGYAQFFCEAKS